MSLKRSILLLIDDFLSSAIDLEPSLQVDRVDDPDELDVPSGT